MIIAAFLPPPLRGPRHHHQVADRADDEKKFIREAQLLAEYGFRCCRGAKLARQLHGRALRHLREQLIGGNGGLLNLGLAFSGPGAGALDQ